MKSDIEIARETDLRKIKEVATTLGIPREEVQNYGRYIAKVPIHLIDKKQMDQHNLILVTAITPTKAGIGKTTVSIGLALGLNKIGKKAVVALREPSLGPCFGMKGGAAGGGYAQVLPMENINLHFTGDFHAVTSAHNMITALLEMCFANTEGGLNVMLKDIPEPDLSKVLFAENPGILIQVKDTALVEKILQDAGVGFAKIAKPIVDRKLNISKDDKHLSFDIDHLRDLWFKSSYLLDRKQSGEQCAKERYENYKNQPLQVTFGEEFSGKLSKMALSADRKTRSNIVFSRACGRTSWICGHTLVAGTSSIRAPYSAEMNAVRDPPSTQCR